jgi:ABC-type antimicrobial peptide transport system permease subunit
MSLQSKIIPPQWPLKLLKFFVKKEYLEEIEGDMEEIFLDNVERISLKQARRIYTIEMFKLLRPVLLRNIKSTSTINQLPMFKNYFKTSYRGLMKSPLNSFINIFGLAMAIGFCLFVYSFAQWTYRTDQFHENKNEVYLATFLADRDGTPQQHGQSPRPLGEMLRGDFANIKKVCRVEDRNVVLKYKDHVFHEHVRFTDPEFLQMLTFPLKWGAASSLADINSIILSEEMAVKYFGEENPIGLDILMKFDDKRSKAFKITGVAEAFPKSHTIDFNFLINVENLRIAEPGYDFTDWSKFVNATLIQVDNPSDLNAIAKGMDNYRTLQNKAVQEDWAISSFVLEPLSTLHERSEEIQDDISWSTRDNAETIVYLSIIGILLLALACFNYINIAIVSAAKRLKEIGVRKTIGATRGVVIVQFLTENIVITFFALLLGFILGITIFIPGFEKMWLFSMGFRIMDAPLWIYLTAIALVTGIAAGIYPAFYISRFEVVKIMKGSVQFGQKNPLTKLFLGVQLVIACILITSAVMFTQNTAYLSKRNWGYNQETVLYANVPDHASFEQLNAAMTQDPNVLSIAGSSHHLGRNHTTTVVQMPDRQYEVDQLSVDANYFETMGLRLQQGRVFKDNYASDKQAVVVNELFVKSTALDTPIEHLLKIDSMQYVVVGVVSDFHNSSFSNKVRPTIFKVSNEEEYRYLTMKVRSGSEQQTYKALEAQWAKLFPETPFQGGFQEDVWGNYFVGLGIHATFWKVIAFIAVLLASLGLYGLVRINLAGRIKEFSIRKVLGAGIKNITAIILQQYSILIVVALIIGAPVSFILIKLLIESAYEYHMPVTYSGVIIAVTILMITVLTTISIQIRKVLKSNPVNGLKVD